MPSVGAPWLRKISSKRERHWGVCVGATPSHPPQPGDFACCSTNLVVMYRLLVVTAASAKAPLSAHGVAVTWLALSRVASPHTCASFKYRVYLSHSRMFMLLKHRRWDALILR